MTYLRFNLPSLASTESLARQLAALARRGDTILLWGDLGTGKTTFARAFIRARCPDMWDVPSPTFTLAQVYEPVDELAAAVYHFDLYRIKSPEELIELAIDDAWADGITLIEWPDRLGAMLPDVKLDVRLEHGPSTDSRRALIDGHRSWLQRLERLTVDQS